MFDTYPVKCTGKMALVFLLFFSSINFSLIQKSFLQSTNTGFAPISVIAPIVATKVFAAVITSSPLPTPRHFLKKV